MPGENLEIVQPTFEIGSLVRGEVEPFFLDQQSIPYEVIELSDTLPDLGGINLFTGEAQARPPGERTRAFVKASNRGWQYALDHPEEIVDLILRSYKPTGNGCLPIIMILNYSNLEGLTITARRTLTLRPTVIFTVKPFWPV